MFKYTVEYEDFNENARKEDLYFHLSSPEMIRLTAEIGKPLDEYIKDLIDNEDLPTLIAFLEKMLLSSYGVKTTDGKSFMKSKEVRDAFEYSQAYAELFEAMLTDPNLARKFGENVSDKKNKKNQVDPKVLSKESPPEQG